LLLLHSLTRSVWEATSLNGALREVVSKICESTGWSVGLAWLPRDGELRLAEASYGEDLYPEYVRTSGKLRLRIGQDCAGWCWESRKPLWIKDVDRRTFFRRREVATQCGLRTGIWIPVITADEVAAVLEFLTPQSLIEDRCLVGLVTTIAGQLGSLLNRKSEEDSLRQTRDELAAANASLGRELRRHQEMLAKITHELRTPLAGILSMSEALRDDAYGPLSGDQRESLRSVEETGRHLLDLVNDLLDVCRHAAGELGVEPNPVVLEDVCQTSLEIVAPIARQRRQSITFECEPRGTVVHWDARRVRQVLVNLLSNAIKFTPEEGSLGLRVTLANDKTVRLVVWDRGIGMRPDQLERVFRPFVSEDVAVDWEYGSSGVGLYLAKQLVSAHRGNITVTSEPGRGTEFTLELPLGAPPEPQAAAEPSKVERVMVVDDSPIQRMLMADLLTRRGYEVAQASDGEEAVQLADKFRPDFVLMDFHLPTLDGAHAVAAIREFNHWAPIHVLSGVASIEARDRSLKAGATGYRQKPGNLDELRGFLDSHLPQRVT
jgi:signal transduction histidine kinase/ActR/RegA family two-component response regulator